MLQIKIKEIKKEWHKPEGIKNRRNKQGTQTFSYKIPQKTVIFTGK